MKKIVAAVILIVLSVNLFVLIPWEVTVYRGEYVHIIQSPGKTEMVKYPRRDMMTDHITDHASAESLEAVLDTFLSDGDVLTTRGVEEQVTQQLPRLDKLYVPAFSCGEIETESVSISGGVVNYQLRDENKDFFINGEMAVCCATDCNQCAQFEKSFQNWKSQGKTERYLEINGIKAVRVYGEIDVHGEIDGIRFHAVFTVDEQTLDEAFLSGIGFQTRYTDHSAMLPYWLTEAGRILSVALFVTGGVLLVLGLLPLRKKQTVPDG